jgi:hypothetical protein
MFRRAVALTTLGAFLVSTWSCSVHRQIPLLPETLVAQGDVVGLKRILTMSGGRIEFSTGVRAQVTKDRLVVTHAEATVRVAEADLQKPLEGNPASVSQLLTKDGVEYSGDVVARKPGTITLRASKVIVPMSEVDQVSIEKLDGGKVFLVTLGVAAAAFAAILAIALATKESCPFVYSYDGSTYMLDGEPYGGATSPGLKRTDWGGLKYLKEVGGEYRFKVTNEVDETQYTDELKLVVVDHPRGVSVVADELGVVHSVTAPVPPARAVDTRGRDIRSYVNEDDWVYWRSAERDMDPESASGTKETLVFEFPKPAGAKRAKFVFDGGNTLWASQMVKGFLALRGRDLGEYYASLSTPGPALLSLLSWNLREELYRMNIRVSTTSGWTSKGTVAGGGPFVSRARVYALDIADVPGDVLRIELTPAIGFWMINHLAVDYSDDVAFTAQEVEAARAVDSRGTDIRPLLAASDGRFFAMPETGDSADVVFNAPPRADGLERTVILKANGYYDIHMGSLGEPRLDILARVRAEPGYAVRYAWGEYRKWLVEQQAGAAR